MYDINSVTRRLKQQTPNRPAFYANSRTPDIIGMLKAGHSYAEISKKLGVSTAHISSTRKRYIEGQRRFTVEGLSDQDCLDIWKQAEVVGCTVAELARAYIIDGIEENKEKPPIK